MAEPFGSTFLVFVDMLGFASLVEEEGDEISDLSPVFTGVELYAPSRAESLLGYRFINFHRCINEARTRLQELGAGTAIVFSDSAFLRVDDLEHAVDVARRLMFDLVSSEIPARMGVAHGSYRMLRFLTDTSANVSFHMSQFLGTGVVRAYQAEQSGVPGMRIVLHPSLEPMLDAERLKVIPLNPAVACGGWEVNYLESAPSSLGPDFDDCIQFDCLRSMLALAPEPLHYHYVETYHAWNRMRRQLGREVYPWEKFLDRSSYDSEHRIQVPVYWN